MWIVFIGDVLDVLGKIMIAMTALAVHDTVMNEHKIDDKVNKSIKREHLYAYLGITFLVVGFLLRQLGRYLV